MRAIVFDHPGDASVLHIGEVPSPAAGPGEVLIRVAATAVNRADLLQRRGLYPPPPGASEILGLECSGEITASPETRWAPGERVMALLPGGGYAEEAAVHAGSLMKVPGVFSDEEAAAFPEVFLTAFLNIFMLGGASRGQKVLVHGGGSGVGTASIALCREAGVDVAITAGSDVKCGRCLELGASIAVNYHTEDFVKRIGEWTGGGGVDVILDSIGATYLGGNIAALAQGGRLVNIGGMGGRKAELDLGAVLSRRLTIIGSTLRSRPADEKSRIVDAFVARFGDALEGGRIRPVIDRVLPLDEASEAHRLVEASGHFGKVVLRVR